MDLEYIQIETTTRCNYKCCFCCGRKMVQGDLEWPTFEKIVNTFKNITHIELQGEGESLLHLRFFDMVTLLNERNIKVSFISNGSLLNEKNVELLLKRKVEKIMISIESADPVKFKSLRGGDLEIVMQNISNLISEKKKRKLQNPAIGFALTVLNSTKDNFMDVIHLYKKLGMDGGITIQPLQRMDSYFNNYSEEVQNEVLDDKQVEAIAMRTLADKRIRLANKKHPIGFYEGLFKGWYPCSGKCPYLEKGLYINRNGDVSPCCTIKDTARWAINIDDKELTEKVKKEKEYMKMSLAKKVIPALCKKCEIAKYATMKKKEFAKFSLKFIWSWFLYNIAPHK